MNSQKFEKVRWALLAAFIVSFARVQAAVPAGIKNEAYDGLLKKYVNDHGLVAYEKWKANSEDLKGLDDYVAQFSRPGNAANGDEKFASYINAYNAFVLQWILRNYPTESIWQLKSSFKGKRYNVGGETVSLDDIENGVLRPEFGYRTHAVLVCAARSCPPLQQSAYSAEKLNDQVANAYRTWLGRSDLNEFMPAQNESNVSSIFKWFAKDFQSAGGAKAVIAKYAPTSARAMLERPDTKLTFKPYNWGLNDDGAHGRNYKQKLLDYLH